MNFHRRTLGLFLLAAFSVNAEARVLLRPGAYAKAELPKRSSVPWMCLVTEGQARIEPCEVQAKPVAGKPSMLQLEANVPAAFLFRGVKGIVAGPIRVAGKLGELSSFRVLPPGPVGRDRQVVWSGDLNRDNQTDHILDIGSPYATATLQLALSQGETLEFLEKTPTSELVNETPETVRALLWRDGPHLLSPAEAVTLRDKHPWIGQFDSSAGPEAVSFRNAASEVQSLSSPSDPTPLRFDTGLVTLVHQASLPAFPTGEFPVTCEPELKRKACEARLRKEKPRVTLYGLGPGGLKRLKNLPVVTKVEGQKEERTVTQTVKLSEAQRRDLVFLFDSEPSKKGRWIATGKYERVPPDRLPAAFLDDFGAAAIAEANWSYPERAKKLPALVEMAAVVVVDDQTSKTKEGSPEEGDRASDASAPDPAPLELRIQRFTLVVTEKLYAPTAGTAFIDFDAEDPLEIFVSPEKVEFLEADGIRRQAIVPFSPVPDPPPEEEDPGC